MALALDRDYERRPIDGGALEIRPERARDARASVKAGEQRGRATNAASRNLPVPQAGSAIIWPGAGDYVVKLRVDLWPSEQQHDERELVAAEALVAQEAQLFAGEPPGCDLGCRSRHGERRELLAEAAGATLAYVEDRATLAFFASHGL